MSVMKKDLDKIKKLYGEDFARNFCRQYFSHVLEREDFSFTAFLTSIIAPSRFFYEDLLKSGRVEKFRDALFGMLSQEQTEEVDIQETPEELMKKVGYTLYKCITNDDILKFKKYYAKGEEICTFKDEQRVNTHIVFWAVKDNAESIKRSEKPEREDEYGTSVISIQFTRGIQSTLSIKNRYNHTVEYPDATFSNNLEEIHPGLTASFKKYYGIQLVNGGQAFDLPGYVVDNNGIYHKYNYAIENIYYCVDNKVVTNGECVQYDPTRYIFADYYLIDRKEKTVHLLPGSRIWDTFVYQFENIKKIDVTIDGENKNVLIYQEGKESIEIVLNKYGKILKFTNNNVESLGSGFMQYSSEIEEITLNNVKEIGDYCLMDNTTLKKFDADSIEKIGNRALASNQQLTSLSWKKIREIGDFFLTSNRILDTLDFPKLTSVGAEFMYNNNSLKKLSFPKLRNIQPGFLKCNNCAESFYSPVLDPDKYLEVLTEHLKGLKKDNLFAKLMHKMPKVKKIDVWDLL